MYSLVVEIYESQRRFPIVVHVFNGTTKREAMGYFEAHMKTDSFLRGCVSDNQFGNIRCRSTVRWEQR